MSNIKPCLEMFFILENLFISTKRSIMDDHGFTVFPVLPLEVLTANWKCFIFIYVLSYNLISRIENGYDRICTNDCTKFPDYFKFFNRCLPKNAETLSLVNQIKYIFVELSEDFELYWEELIQLCTLSLVLSLAILLLFQYCVEFIVWILLISIELASISGAIVLWALWINKKQEHRYPAKENVWLYLGFAIGATMLSMIIGLVIICMRKKIELVVQLFKEAGEAVGSIPALLLEPIITFLAFAATVACGIYFFLWIGSAGHLTERDRRNVFSYHKDGWMKAAAVLNVIGMLWMYQFIVGCQHMIVAGAVSKWYFTRDKSHLSSPITESAYNLTRYHLGSVAVGSFLITLIKILKIIIYVLRNALKNKKNNILTCLIKACLCLCNCCLNCAEMIAHIITGNAYVIVAMYGYSFYKAGKKAFANLVEHPFSLATINSVGDFVLFLAKVLVVLVTEVAASYLLKDKGLHYLWTAMLVIGLVSFSISHCFITVYEMIIDTIFICFCEDSQLNDGISKHYYMSRGLMEYVDNSKKALESSDQRRLYGHQQSTLTGENFVSQSPKSAEPKNRELY